MTLVKKYDTNKKLNVGFVQTLKERTMDPVATYFKQINIPYKNISNIVEFPLSLSGTNVAIERVFLVSKIWVTKKMY